MNPLIHPPAIGEIVPLLFFCKDGFVIDRSLKKNLKK